MTERLRTRPKSSAMMRASLNFSSVKAADNWRTDTNDVPMWSGDNNSMLGIRGSKCTPHSWQMSFGPHSGGFLPVLKTSKPTNSIPKTLKRHRSATTRNRDPTPSTSGGGGKIVSTNTASLLDLTSIMPSAGAKKGVVKLYRENSLPADMKIMQEPVLRYSHDNGVTSVLSKLDLLDGGDIVYPPTCKVTGSKTTSNDKLTASSYASSTSAYSIGSMSLSGTKPPLNHNTDDTRQSTRAPVPPSTPRALEVPKIIDPPAPPSTPKPPDSVTSNELIIKEVDNSNNNTDKWKLKVDVPLYNDYSLSTYAKLSPMDESNSTTPSDEINLIKDAKNPKSKPTTILKPAVSESEPPRKKVVGVSNYMLPTPTPPTIKPQSNNPLSRKRITRQKNTDLTSENSIDTMSESDSTSVEPESDSTTVDSSSKTIELIKSVRFAEQPANIKEYYPWEPPQNSIVYEEHRPPPRRPLTKSNPVFKP